MSAIDSAITTHNALARLYDTRVIEIGPQSNYQTDMLRNDAYRWAKQTGRTVTTSTERVASDPFKSVLRVRLVEGDAA